MQFLMICLLFLAVLSGYAAEQQVPAVVRIIQQSNDLQQAGKMAEAAQLMRNLLATPGISPLATGVALNELALAEHSRNRYEEAEPLYLRAIKTLESAEGAAPVFLLRARLNLAALYIEGGRPDEAESQRDRVSMELLTDTADISQALSVTASLAAIRGDLDKAKAAYEENLAFLQRHGGPGNGLQIATTLNNLGTIEFRQSHWAEAERWLQLAVNAQRATSGDSHPNLMKLLFNLAYTRMQQKKYAVAREPMEEAVRIARESIGDSHLTTAAILTEYSSLLSKAGLRAEAKAAKREADQIRREAPPSLPGGMTVDVSAFRSFMQSDAQAKTENARTQRSR